MPIPKTNAGEKVEEDDELAAFLDRMVSDADQEAANIGGVGGGSSNFDCGYVYRPGPYDTAKTNDATTMEKTPDDDPNDVNNDDSPKTDTVVSYEDVFKSDSPDGGNLFQASQQSTFSFDAYKSLAEKTLDEAVMAAPADNEQSDEVAAVPSIEPDDSSIVQVQENDDMQQPDPRPINPDAKAKAIVVESQKSQGTLEWMERFKKIGMKSEEQVTTINDDGTIIQQGPAAQPFHYSFKIDKSDDKDGENDLFSPDSEDTEDYEIPLPDGDKTATMGEPVDSHKQTDDCWTEIVEESVTEEEVVEESLHSSAEPIASELLTALTAKEDPPGEGNLEEVEFEEVEEDGDDQVDEEEETDSSVEAGPIPEEIQKGEIEELTSAYDPEAEYDASESSEEEDTEMDGGDEEEEVIVEEEFMDETVESSARAKEDGLLLAALRNDIPESGEDLSVAVDIENQSQHVFSKLEYDSEGGAVREKRAFLSPDITKREESKRWTLYVLLLAMLLLAGVIGALIVLSQQNRGSPRSSVVPMETPAPSQQPTVTPIPTLSPSMIPSMSPTRTPMPNKTPSMNPTDLPTITSSPTVLFTEIQGPPTSPPQFKTDPPISSPMELIQSGENDTCETALGPLNSDGSPNFGSIASATLDGTYQCGDVVHSGPGVWYAVVGTGGEMLAHTCLDTAFDSKITVFSSTCDNLNCIEANDNFCGSSGTQSAVSWFSTYGQEYRILLSGESGVVDGSYNLVIESRRNDDCSTAIGPLSVEETEAIMGNTLQATPDAISCDGTTNESPSVWYLVTGTGSRMTANVCNDTNFLARVRVLAGSCASQECIAVSGIIDCTVSWDSVEFQSYYIMISGQSAGNVGSFSMTLTSTE